MKCREKDCNGTIMMVKEKYARKYARKYRCNKCKKEYFVYRGRKKRMRPQI